MEKNTSPKNTEKSHYLMVHRYMYKNFGKPKVCDNGCKGKIRFEWALKKDKKYEAKRENFLRLCRSCHNIYDKITWGNVGQGENHNQSKLKNEDIKIMRKMRKNGFPNKLIAEKFKISSSHASNITRGLKWGHVVDEL